MIRKIIIWVLVVLGLVLILSGYGVYRFFFSMRYLPEGEFMCKSTSPQGTYTVNLYITNPALSCGGTRGEVINNETGKKRNIYWEFNRDIFEAGIAGDKISWENNETVIINGRRLNVKKDTFDRRRN